jgi:hypothetical protein
VGLNLDNLEGLNRYNKTGRKRGGLYSIKKINTGGKKPPEYKYNAPNPLKIN